MLTRLFLIATLAVFGVSTLECSSISGQSSYTINGTVTALATEVGKSQCLVYKLERAQVTIRNQSGTILATALTGDNTERPAPLPAAEQADIDAYLKVLGTNTRSTPIPEKEWNDHELQVLQEESCIVTFTAKVPKTSFYQMTIGTHGGPNYSFDELKHNNWKMVLSLGQ